MNGLTQVRPARLAALITALLAFASVGYGAPVVLTNGVPVTGLSGAAGSENLYTITVPAGQNKLDIAISGGTGDCDLYVKRGAAPTTTSYDYRPFLVGNNETVDVNNPVADTWYIMLRGYTAYAGLTLVASYSPPAVTITTLTNNVPVTGLSGAAAGEAYFKIEVPASQTKLEISIAGGTGDCDLYVKKDTLPTVSSYDYRPFLAGNNEKVTIDNPAAGTWYIMLRGYSAYSGVTLLGSYAGNVGTLLVNGVAVTGISGAANSEKLYRIGVPAGQILLEIMISGGTGDCDLYVKRGAPPTASSYDYRPFLAGNNETVDVNNPTADTWYIMLRGYTDYAGLSLQATYGDAATLNDGVAVTGLAGALNSEKFYKLEVPAGCSLLQFAISGGTGNCDLYVRLGAKPTTSTYDYRPYLSGNNETASINLPHNGTWYVMLKGRQAYSGVTLMGDYTVASTVTTLSNGVPVTGLSGADGSQVYYQITVPSGQTLLEIKISGGTGDADLYVKKDATPAVDSYDYRPYLVGNDETVTVANPDAGNWMIMIRGYNAYTGMTLVATYTGPTGGEVTTLSNGVPVTGLSGATGSVKYFKIDVPAGQSQLEIQMSGGTGDADLYVRKDTKPTQTEWDYRPFLVGNNETVTINNPDAGTYYIMLDGFDAYANVTLEATYIGAPEVVIELTNGVPVTGISGAAGTDKFYKIVVPAGQDTLHIAISGGTGDCDLYVKKGSKPSLSSWDYQSTVSGNDDSVDIANPAAATWYIMLDAYWPYTDVTLVALYQVTLPAGNVYSTDPNCVAVWKLEPGALTIDSRSTNKLTNIGVTSNTTDFQQGTGSAIFERLNTDSLRIIDANLSAAFPTKSGRPVTTFSGSCWTKLYSFPSTTYLMSKYLPPAKMSWGLGIGFGGNVGFRIGWNGGADTEVQWSTLGSLLLPNRWYHVAFAYNDSAKTCYLRVYDKTADVVIVNETLHFTHNMSATTATFVLGGLDAPDPGYSLDGLLDEAVVFNDLLTIAQIDKIRLGTYGHP